MSIRSTAKAIIIDNDKILLNKCFDEHNGEYYSLPGGGQHTYETLQEAVVRECLEETGYNVTPVAFAALCEEICDDLVNREQYPEYTHRMLHIFMCKLSSDIRSSPTEIDDMQLSAQWIDLKDLKSIHLLPKLVNDNIENIISNKYPVFLGSEHISYNHG